ncbi:MAG: DUF3311 domain-containing protein [Acidibrevibacterium sp.]|jgi:hypothetical protein|uniref:DUF3311 domain-containing protein n=1 Tax=Acidibrevibacterium fodinaquatile TaxID=1969806 RepID=UPI000E0CEBA2|nr:DUF3311 domain-containing protein [Acidibrevibacterium fodinaquatile]MCA7120220.1 DUF3311 domain-containing protein [Acidibrevibacterium fodinaquatile]
MKSPDARTKAGRTRLRWLLLAPFVAMLDVGSYNRMTPTLAGIPFFYWYQLLWILIAAAIIFLVHQRERSRDESEGAP